MSTLPFLVEIGTEELPPRALPQLSRALLKGLQQQLEQARLDHGPCHAYASPRRLAVLVEGLSVHQPPRPIERLGPAVTAAFDAEGRPTRAAEGFARSNGVAVDQLERVATDKGERLAFRTTEAGQSARELLPQLVAAALDQLPIDRRMRWGASREEFVRPVHWLVMLLGDDIVPARILGVESGRLSRGHRFHSAEPFTLSRPEDYARVLAEEHHVLADFAQRRDRIREQVTAEADRLQGRALLDEALLDEVTALVEWPVVLSGSFDARFLEVPAEALISSMQEHQRYFPVVDDEGNLLPHFIFVANIDSQDPAQVIQGNERVIRPRLADAAFFYDTDRRSPLADRREQLKGIVFQDRLGSMWDKSLRVSRLAERIAEAIGGNPDWARRAAELAKCDLVTEMVLEFDDLQGVAGRYYALRDGEPEEVALALEEQYRPRFAGDALPETPTGMALAIADRLDTLVGIFGIGELPTGSKDPFALRRAAQGILRLCVVRELDLDLQPLLEAAQDALGDRIDGEGLTKRVLTFMLDRFRAWYEEENIATEVFQAVSARHLSRPLDIDQRVHAVHRFSQLPQAEALAAANKRVSNLLSQAGSELDHVDLDPARLIEPAEQALAQALQEREQVVRPLLDQHRYEEALADLAALREPVDRFFDEVMVMAEDVELRHHRLALLRRLRQLFMEVADISLLAG